MISEIKTAVFLFGPLYELFWLLFIPTYGHSVDDADVATNYSSAQCVNSLVRTSTSNRRVDSFVGPTYFHFGPPNSGKPHRLRKKKGFFVESIGIPGNGMTCSSDDKK